MRPAGENVVAERPVMGFGHGEAGPAIAGRLYLVGHERRARAFRSAAGQFDVEGDREFCAAERNSITSPLMCNEPSGVRNDVRNPPIPQINLDRIAEKNISG